MTQHTCIGASRSTVVTPCPGCQEDGEKRFAQERADIEGVKAIRLALGNPSATVDEICARIRRMTEVEEALAMWRQGKLDEVFLHDDPGGTAIVDALIRARREAGE